MAPLPPEGATGPRCPSCPFASPIGGRGASQTQAQLLLLEFKFEVPCRWPVAGVGPLPVGPMPQNAQNSVIATRLEMFGFLSKSSGHAGACEAQVTDGSSAPNSAMAVSSSGRNGHGHM